MKTQQVQIKNFDFNQNNLKSLTDISPNLVMLFGGFKYFEDPNFGKKMKEIFPKAILVGCSTAGEISNSGVYDNSMVLTAVNFQKSQLKSHSAQIKSMDDSFNSGKEIGAGLKGDGLKSVFVLGRGIDINGSAVIEGIRAAVGKDVIITGGLAGDSGRFQQTYTFLNGEASDDSVIAVGFYGNNIKITFGSMGGWEAFGPIRSVTKSRSNVLYELDGQPALDIYKKYLGEKAKDLPSSGLLFPFLLLKENTDSSGVVRTILGVNEADKSLTFAGDIPMQCRVRLMHADNDGLVEGAKGAAESALGASSNQDSLSILISCVGRKLVMGADIDEELDAVKGIFGKVTTAGFYSYGEICPLDKFSECKLHNQTMTITYFSEAA